MDASLLLLKFYLDYLELPTRGANYAKELNNYAIYLGQCTKADMGYRFIYLHTSSKLTNDLYALSDELRYEQVNSGHELHLDWQVKLNKIKPLLKVPFEISGLSIDQKQWLKWVTEYHYALKVQNKSQKELDTNNPLAKIIRKELKKAGLI